MTHMVIVNTADEKSHIPCDDLESAIATIERFRNEENVESCELFELHPITFEFRPYYHVAISNGAASTSDVSAVTAAPAPLESVEDPATTVNTPVLSAVESSDPFGTTAAPAPTTSLSDAFVAAPAEAVPSAEVAEQGTSPFDTPAPAPSALDTAMANAGVPSEPIPPLPEAIPPAPAFGSAPVEAMPESTDPFAQVPQISDTPQSPAEAAAVATGSTGLGFELGGDNASTAFDPGAAQAPAASASSGVSDLFDSGAELPPPPPPPPVEVDEEPRRGLFGR